MLKKATFLICSSSKGQMRDGWLCAVQPTFRPEIRVYVLSQPNNWCSQSFPNLEGVLQWYSSWGTCKRKIKNSQNQGRRLTNFNFQSLANCWTPMSFKLWDQFICNLQNLRLWSTVYIRTLQEKCCPMTSWPHSCSFISLGKHHMWYLFIN